MSSTTPTVDVEEVIEASGTENVRTLPADADGRFHAGLAALEECIMKPTFRDPLVAFCKKHCVVFDPSTDEQKLEYMTLFNAYTGMVEDAIEAHLQETFDGALGLADFEQLLADRMSAASASGVDAAEELSGDVFDVLMSLGDYDEFRSLMLSYREQVEYQAVAAAVGGGGALAAGATAASAAALAPVAAATADGSATSDAAAASTAASPSTAAAAAAAPVPASASTSAAPAPAASAAGGAAAGRRAGSAKASTGGGDFVADFGGLSIMGTSISGKR